MKKSRPRQRSSQTPIPHFQICILSKKCPFFETDVRFFKLILLLTIWWQGILDAWRWNIAIHLEPLKI
jgi:hypothetical protein